MKKFRKIISFVLTMAMCLSLGAVAFAEDDEYTITVENSIGGAAYNAYKIFDAAYHADTGAVSYTIDGSSEWYAYISGNTGSAFFNLTQTAVEGVYQVTLKETASEPAVIEFLNSVCAGFGDSLPAAGTGIGNGGRLDMTVGEPGYYFVTTTTGAVVSITTAAPTATIIDKNQKPGEGGGDPTDPVPWEGGFTKEEDDISFSVGDEVEYLIRSYVPTYDGDKQVTSYTITDTMSKGLTLEAQLNDNGDGTFTVTGGVKVELVGSGIVDAAENPVTEDITGECTITVSYDAAGGTILTVYWEIEKVLDDGLIYPADAVVRISYTDEVNELADDEDLKNIAGMSWMMIDPDDPYDPIPGESEDKPEVIVYTYGFDLKKTDGTDENVLQGAQFTLRKQGDGELISFVYDEETDTYEEWDKLVSAKTTTTITVGDGEVNVWGLGAGTYILTEIAAPDGYNLLDKPVTIEIAEDEHGWTVTVDGGTPAGGVISDTDSHGVSSMPTVTVINNAGRVLPSTGGMGTAVFYVIGAILVCGAAVLLIMRRRTNHTK